MKSLSSDRSTIPFPGKYMYRSAVIAFLTFLAVCLPAGSMTPREKPQPPVERKMTARALTSIGANLAQSFRQPGAAKTAGTSLSGIQRDAASGTPVYIDRETLEQLGRQTAKRTLNPAPLESAIILMDANPGLFRLRDPRNELQVLEEFRDSGGRLHLKLGQIRDGVPVQGCGMVLHFDADGSMYAFTGRYVPTPSAVNSGTGVSSGSAIELAARHIAGKTVSTSNELLKQLFPTLAEPSAVLVLHTGSSAGEPRFAWKVELRPNARERWIVFVDAQTGAIIESWQDNPGQDGPTTATATDVLGVSRTIHVSLEKGVYYLADQEANIFTYSAGGKVIAQNEGIPLVSCTDNIWTNAIAVSAHANTRETIDYYLREHGRDGVDGKRMNIPVIVNYTEDGTPYDNAFWAGEYMAFGDGLPYASALDVVAHEITHGVTQFTVGLEYRFQSGALNEMFSDLMAAFVDPDWLIAEDLPGGAIRNVLEPTEYDLPGHMNNYKQLTIEQDNGGVHINVGIPSRACALLTEAIGRDKAADLLYHILDSRYLSPRANFSDLRLAAAQSAQDLYGADSPEAAAVQTSFDAVGISAADSSQSSDDVAPPLGGEWIAYVNNGRLTLSRPAGQGNEVITPDIADIYTGTACPYSIDRNGNILIFVDFMNDLRMLDLETLDEYMMDESGEWSSIALSPDGTLLAATSIYADSTLYIFDLENAENSKAVRLYTPGTEMVKSYTALYADALDWDISGTHVIYDQFNSVPTQGGDPVEFWNINSMEAEYEVIVNIQVSNDRTLQVGNPSFAKVNDRYIVCDLLSDETEYCAVTTVDLFSGTVREVVRTGYYTFLGARYPNLGIPRYAPDDRALVFEHYDASSEISSLYTILLADDRMSPAGLIEDYRDGYYARWFIRGGETVVEDDAGELPVPFALGLNHPNPFNPATVIPFTLSAPSRVKLEVFDTLGQRVALLVNGELPAGNHEAVFNGAHLGSGAYFARLRAGSAVQTRKMTLLK